MLRPGINLKLGLPLLIVAFAISAAALYGGAQLVKQDEVEAEGGVVDGGGGPASNEIMLVAEGIMFDRSSVTVNASAEITVTLDNRDAAVPHNIAFYTDRSAAQQIFASEIFNGPDVQVSTLTAPSAPGNYFFRCDVHPDSMTGTFIVQ